MQGRRDFAFGLDQAKRAYAALAGPKQLWIGLHGHAPSSGVAADTPAMLAEGARWFDRFLRGDTARPLSTAGRDRAGALARPAAAVRGPAEGRVRVVRPRSARSARAIAQSGRYRIPVLRAVRAPARCSARRSSR